ncbi:hypothetical protein KSE_12935 [Kitasatospora setae KM-6054]|uniref:Knr4/Smi1-like domain-containing protein n=1 Tax=Kitasatospora setae (strain ATCC 33774 / DSM 43861 / JCM 3304 / KCC A-0304 / NBRC 14216 / KM-6054) TaxID=452652 RepID=E4N7E3_KITSK|nr:hypothetical protein KSE_12935 [Kitasatospora setae KM-6054]
MLSSAGSPTSSRSSSVRSRVAAMALEDPERRRFGASRHGYRLQPPLPEEAIRSFEHLHGVTLPASYRDFLGTVADGGAGPHYGLLSLTGEVDDDEALHDLRAECLRAGFLATLFPHTTDWPGPGRGETPTTRSRAPWSSARSAAAPSPASSSQAQTPDRSGSTTSPGVAWPQDRTSTTGTPPG